MEKMNKLNKPATLPLSWQYSSSSFKLNEIPLLIKKHIWLTSAKCDFQGFEKSILSRSGEQSESKLIIRGCNNELADKLYTNGYDKIIFGKEAVLEFGKDHFNRRSLKELIRRGLRHGDVIEVPRNDVTIEKLNEFRNTSRHSREPQLKHLFVTEFLEETRLFVFHDKHEQWLGAVLVSVNSTNKYHTELLLKHMNAPAGIMEALIYRIYKTLETDGKKEFSLGEVPFIVKTPISRRFYRDFILNRIAKLFRFAYNYEGLYRFKNKFNPRWDEVYICGYPKLKLSHIAGIIIRSNLFRLIIYKASKILYRYKTKRD